MSDRKRYDIDWSRLTPAEAAVVDEFAAAFRAIQEIETKRMQLTVYQLELLRDGMAALNADLRAGRL
jgi:hypothetical protein